MTKLNLEAGKQAMVIVAHPDDESIWMGGFISKYRDLDWTILSLCRASDPDRAPKFHKVCEHLNAKPIIEDMDDEGNLSFEQSLPIIKQLVLKNLKGKTVDYLFTHGENGEYGHEAHCAIHKVIKQLANEGSLTAESIFYFNYKKARQPKNEALMEAKQDSDFLLRLTNNEFNKKKKILTKLYGFDPSGIDANYCTNPEAFKIITKSIKN